MSIPPNLIINADDFGLDARISRAIAKALDEGLINSFSVFPFADAYHHQLLKDVIKKHPEAKVGCHLSLINPAGAIGRAHSSLIESELPMLKESPHHFLQF